MAFATRYADQLEPTRAEVEAGTGWQLLEFGTDWCGHCQAAQPAVRGFVDGHPDLAHRKVEDGKGRPLGRAFTVKLWPTLVLLKDGQEQARVVRPTAPADLQPLEQALHAG
ncbi:thioredoxin family protein [Stenotrophomonas aracearum]|jgi:thioredoxin 1|uniref:Thioredoxin family protein n=1 Tax=Stenotrophomonas aracearum TaxID=3003272 RepID=A0ABY9Y8K3_9GAMM|nr:thioredoxin family protein [Stenotrophomonas sp. A5588]WNH47136.1 thioredoxin family protein [Stenotrophomonas sp. A5588]